MYLKDEKNRKIWAIVGIVVWLIGLIMICSTYENGEMPVRVVTGVMLITIGFIMAFVGGRFWGEAVAKGKFLTIDDLEEEVLYYSYPPGAGVRLVCLEGGCLEKLIQGLPEHPEGLEGQRSYQFIIKNYREAGRQIKIIGHEEPL